MLSMISAVKKTARSIINRLLFLRNGGKHGENPRFNSRFRANRKTIVGNNVHCNGITVIGSGEVVVGDNFHCGFGCIFITENHKYRGADHIPYGKEYDVRSIRISENVWLGINVTLLPGISIGEGAIIQAGSVVVKDVESLSIVGGNPAKPFSQRDSEHYFQLKSEGKVL